ncbi:hypothetical protein ABT237_33045 [Streptomyces sp. NPDC001581]|uniref:hypothetical protein n=1 Tax=Streptomyces sp. NPDC001581 TaxID=3154386 RepID=UPI0033302312
MSESATLRRGGRAHRAAALPGAAALTVALAAGCATGAPDGAQAGGTGRAGGTPVHAAAATSLAPSVPDRIRIPRIGVDAPLDAVGLDSQGVMREPDFATPRDAAWYEDGTTAVFAVDAVGMYRKDAFPTGKVYGDTHGRAELRLITCGGRLAPDRHWDANVVVFAHLTGKA